MVLQSPTSGQRGFRAAQGPGYQLVALSPALVWRYSLSCFLVIGAFAVTLAASFGWLAAETSVRLQFGAVTIQTSTLILVGAALLGTAILKMQSTQSRLPRITALTANRPASDSDDDDGGYHLGSAMRDDVLDSRTYYVFGAVALLTVGFGLFHARGIFLGFLAEQGLMVSALVGVIGLLTPIVALIATIGLIESAMRRTDVAGLLAPVMASCGIFVAFMLVQVTHLVH